MPEINADTVPGAVPIPLWLLASLFAGILVVAWWAIRRKDTADAAREKRANEKEDAYHLARENWTTALGKLAESVNGLADRVERQETTVSGRLDRLESAVLNGRKVP